MRLSRLLVSSLGSSTRALGDCGVLSGRSLEFVTFIYCEALSLNFSLAERVSRDGYKIALSYLEIALAVYGFEEVFVAYFYLFSRSLLSPISCFCIFSMA